MIWGGGSPPAGRPRPATRAPDHLERRQVAHARTEATTTPETGDMVRPGSEACSMGITR